MKNELVVVGIGSSAGGLEALQNMLSTLPDIDNCAYVIAQHLSPTHKSMMVELLARSTNHPVLEVKNGLLIKPKTIYMTPENTDIFVKDNKLYLKTIEQSFGPKPSINYFFSSLAQSFNERAIGVILSGTGSDGAHGIRAIKAQGGITIAQSPATAKYDGMPLSAINTGKVDLVVPIENLGKEIESIVNSIDKKLAFSHNDRILQQIFRILFEEQGVDFSLYKRNTIIRRIERRLAALKIESLNDYIKILEENTDEITILFHDILIGVTSFFRDKDAFNKLKKHLENIVSKKEQGEEIRLWSIGCSTGEEAYSIAIILSEILQEKISKYKIKIFATDIDDEALKIARSGIYAETSLEDVDKEIIKKYFTVQKNQFEIKKSLRELVIFSKHNIISDSPFLRLDLVVCRNMLIYFSNTLQNKFFPIVHYALKDNGILFLGKSESVGQNIDLFNIVDKSEKIFKAQFTGIKEPPKLYNYSTAYKKNAYEDSKQSKAKNEEMFLEDVVTESIKEVILNSCVVINSSNDIIYVKGDIPYLKHREGKISNNIFKHLSDELSLDLRSAINKSSKDKQVQITPFRSITIFENIIRYVRVIVAPFSDEKSDDWLYVLFFQAEESQNIKGHVLADGDDNEIIAKLTLELDSTKSHLQNVIEELETSYEEMQSLNEELQSSNEELQSSNEELETTNEELQSTNEELQTAYSELKVLYDDKDKRAKQLEDLTSKLTNKTEEFRKQKELTEGILDTAPIAITMVDKDGKIIYANTYAENLFNLPKHEMLSRSYNSLEWKIKGFNGEDFDLDKLPFSIIKRTYEPIHNIEHTIENDIKKLYLSISGSPLFDNDGKFLGAVFCIENLTNNLNLQSDLDYYQTNLKNKIVKNIKEGNTYLFDMAFLDLSMQIKNSLSELTLQINSINTNDIQIRNIIEESNKTIEYIAQTIEEKNEFFTQRFNYERISLISSIESFMKFFDPILRINNIQYHLDLDPKNDENIEIQKVYEGLYKIFEVILQCFKSVQVKNPHITLNNKKQHKSFIQFELNIDLSNQENLDAVRSIEDTNVKIIKEKNLIFQLVL